MAHPYSSGQLRSRVCRNTAGSDGIQQRIDPVHRDLNEEMNGLHSRIDMLKGARRRSSSDSQSCPVPDGGKRPRRGEWWSTELGVPVEMGKDFVPDTQDGGGEDFIFFPDVDSATSKELPNVLEGDFFVAAGTSVQGEEGRPDRELRHAHEQVERLRQLFPPLPSLVDELRNFMTSMGRKDDKLLLRCGIKPSTHSIHHETITNLDDELLVDEESQAMDINETSQLLLSPSSSTCSDTMFKSMMPYGAPSPASGGTSSYGPYSPPAAAGGTSSYGPYSPPAAADGTSSYGPPAARILRSKMQPPPASPPSAVKSSSSNAGRILRSNDISVLRKMEDKEMK